MKYKHSLLEKMTELHILHIPYNVTYVFICYWRGKYNNKTVI